MSRPWKAVKTAAAAIACLAVAGLLVNPGVSQGDGPKPAQPVVVTNTSLPVMVPGGVTVNGTVPVSVKDPAVRLYRGTGVGKFATGSNGLEFRVTDPVEPGERLVVEYVSLNCVGDPDHQFQIASVGMSEPDGAGGRLTYWFQLPTLTNFLSGEQVHGAVGQHLRLYHDGSDYSAEGPAFVVYRNQTSGETRCIGGVSGYIVNLE